MNEKYPLALPEGTVLAGQYIVEKVLGQGGFGITYEAKDHKTGERVAVKEFFPDAMATRTNQTTVLPFSGEKGENYAYGKTCFLQEAETLAKFIGNENIVRIHSYFEENETAYFVMDFIEGTSFDEYLKQRGGKIPYEEAAQILIPVMDALSAVHSKGIVHRDVTPDNIYITKEGVVKLLDFGAARYSLGDQSRSLDIILKHGFAPKEQYTRRGKQGPYTDIYALGATFYFALTGKRPPDSVERLDEDDLVPPSSLGVQLSGAAEDAILKALSVQPADRFQNMAAFKSALLDPQQAGDSQPPLAAVGSRPAVVQTFFEASDQGGAPHTEPMGGPAPGPGQDRDLQDLAKTMKTAGKLAGKLAGRMAGKVAEKTAETAGIMAGTAGKMSEIMAAKKAETAEKLAAKVAEREAAKAAKAAEDAARREAAQQAAAENAGGDAVGKTVGITGGNAADGNTAGAAAGKSARAKPAMNKKLLLIPAAAAVILLGVLLFKPGGADKDPLPSKGATAGGQENETVQPSARPTAQLPDGSATPDVDATPDVTAASSSKTPAGSLAVAGSYPGNIMNDGLVAVDPNGNVYWVDDSRHSLYSDAEGKYLFEKEEEYFQNLSYDDGKLFFWYGKAGGGTAYAYNPQTKQLEDIPYLADFEGGIIRLFLTEDYYVVGYWDNDGGNDSVVVYLVSRTTGQQFKCCEAMSYNTFTISEDGYLYYVGNEGELEDGMMAVYCVNMATLERSPSLIKTTNTDIELYCPVVAGDYLYFSCKSKSDYTDHALIRVDRATGYKSGESPFWDIGSELDLERNSYGRVEFNVNAQNQDIYFYLYDAKTSAYYLYEVKGHDDGSFDIEQISKESYRPNIIYNRDGSYQLNYLHYNKDEDTYKLYYRDYDANGNHIKTN